MKIVKPLLKRKMVSNDSVLQLQMDKAMLGLLPATTFIFQLRELKICMSAESECYVPTAGVYRQSKTETSSFCCSGETHNS